MSSSFTDLSFLSALDFCLIASVMEWFELISSASLLPCYLLLSLLWVLYHSWFSHVSCLPLIAYASITWKSHKLVWYKHLFNLFFKIFFIILQRFSNFVLFSSCCFFAFASEIFIPSLVTDTKILSSNSFSCRTEWAPSLFISYAFLEIFQNNCISKLILGLGCDKRDVLLDFLHSHSTVVRRNHLILKSRCVLQ